MSNSVKKTKSASPLTEPQVIWKPLPDYKGGYELSNLGQIRSSSNGKIMRTLISDSRAEYIVLRPIDGESGSSICVYLDELVARTFVSNPNEYTRVSHGDGKPLNNKASNLQWVKDVNAMDSPTVAEEIRPPAPRKYIPIAPKSTTPGRFKKVVTMSLSFRLRTTRTEGHATVYCRLYYNSVREGDYASGVMVPIEAWDTKRQTVDSAHPQAQVLKQRLGLVRATHDRILLNFQTDGAAIGNITAKKIKDAFLGRNQPSEAYTLREAMADKIAYLENQKGDAKLSRLTIDNWRLAERHLHAFLVKRRNVNFLAREANHVWAREFYDFLQDVPMKRQTAKKHVAQVSSALVHAEGYDKVEHNGLVGLRLKGDRTKPIHSLDIEQQKALASLSLEGTIHYARQWALLMCHTSLDYRDILAVVANPSKYIVSTPHGDTIVYQRNKLRRVADWGQCHVPVLEETQKLLLEAASWKRPRLRNLNDFLNEIGKQIELPFPFSSKVCRKTAAYNFLNEDFSMQSIQKIMGHKSLTMTENHYLRMQPFVVHKDMAKRQAQAAQPASRVNDNPGTSFLQIYRAS